MPLGSNIDPYFFKNSFVETLKVVSSNPATHQRHIAILACCEFWRSFAKFREFSRILVKFSSPETAGPSLLHTRS